MINSIKNLFSKLKIAFIGKPFRKDVPNNLRVFHDKIIYMCQGMQKFSNEKTVSNDRLARAMFFKLHSYAIVIHKTILEICDNGWAQLTPVLLRSLYDVLINLVVVADKDHEYYAFKYFYKLNINTLINDRYRFNQNDKINMWRELHKELRAADKNTRQKLLEYMKKKKGKRDLGAYWFCPEYKSPSDVIKKLAANKDLTTIYRLLSSSSHGGHIGISLALDNPDNINIDPIHNPSKAQLMVLFSCRLMIEIFKIRSDFEVLYADKIYDKLLTEFNQFRGVYGTHLTV